MADRLLELLSERSVRRGKVILTSGRESDFFVDAKQTVLLAEGHHLVGEAMLDHALALPEEPVAVAGVELGGCPLASAVALASFRRGTPLDAVYVRKTVKEHGSKRQLEGDDHLPPGASIAVLEDTVTTGGSTRRAVKTLRTAGYRVVGVVALVDREEGGAENIIADDLVFRACYRRRDFEGE